MNCGFRIIYLIWRSTYLFPFSQNHRFLCYPSFEFLSEHCLCALFMLSTRVQRSESQNYTFVTFAFLRFSKSVACVQGQPDVHLRVKLYRYRKIIFSKRFDHQMGNSCDANWVGKVDAKMCSNGGGCGNMQSCWQADVVCKDNPSNILTEFRCQTDGSSLFSLLI